QEVIDAGVDEINFDYIRFPSDGPMSLAQYHNQFAEKTEVMKEFFVYLKENLKDEPAYLSGDLFGLTLDHAQVKDENGNTCDNDLNIGQCLPEAAISLDYVYPMAYASHYPPGYLGLANPAQYPYKVIHHGLAKAEPAMDPANPQIRVWLQAFNMGAVYGIDKIREQIKAVEESPATQGWVLWNARNVYNYY
ncbi:MAG: putative glycoside hydrolase, partial [bacterium]